MFNEKLILQVKDAFDARFKNFPLPQGLDEVLKTSAPEEAVCYKFCYAFMPVSDISSYPVELFTKVVKQALDVRAKNLFGESIPDEIFLNFVLQCRINNENLEYNRDFFFDELYPRIKGLSARDASLEINYWCLEKVTYVGNNIRTMSPFTIMKNTKGRCGEESVFTVSALRSVGIPARQIYTPRWAHSESNHAWVEVYVGGGWHFIGACEPEPVVDKGWFTGPASKGIVINARVFSGIPPVGEALVFKTDSVSEINRSVDYVQHTTHFKVKVANGNKNVRVYIQIISYCAFSSLITLTPDENGEASVTIGKGDVNILVADGDKFVTKFVDTRKETDIEINFANAKANGGELALENGTEMLFVPPFSDYQDPDYGLTQAQMDAHEDRVAKCHELRNAYANTFADEAKGLELAKNFGAADFDAAKFFVDAKGNLDEIVKFFDMPNLPLKYKCMILRSLQSKDFTDSTAEILAEHLEYALPYRDDFYEEIFEKYVLCPRVQFEMITPYRAFIATYFTAEQKAAFISDPHSLYNWVEENIKDSDEYKTSNDHSSLMASPVGLLTYGYGGKASRTLLFVATCRTLGIPARINYQDGALEYYKDGTFVCVTDVKEPAATIELTVTEKNGAELSYYENFTVAVLENGIYHVLGLDYGNLQMPVNVEPGHYQIVTGRRHENGAMAVKVWHVEISENTTLEIELPSEEKPTVEVKPLGDYNFGSTKLSNLLSGKDLVACIRPSHEPTEHLLRELLEARAEYKRLGVKVVLVALKDNDTMQKIKAAYEDDVTVLQVSDDDFGQFLAGKTGLNTANLPVVTMVANGNALYYVQGYRVGSVSMALTFVE